MAAVAEVSRSGGQWVGAELPVSSSQGGAGDRSNFHSLFGSRGSGPPGALRWEQEGLVEELGLAGSSQARVEAAQAKALEGELTEQEKRENVAAPSPSVRNAPVAGVATGSIR